MRVAMVAPDKSSEKGIAVYSEELTEAIKKAGVKIDLICYKRGSFLSFLKIIPRLRSYNIIHIQHENRLFGPVDGIFFIPLMLILGLLKRGKIVTTMHTIHTKYEKILSITPLLSWFKRNFIHPMHHKLIGIFSSTIILHTEFLKNDLYENSGISKEKMFVIPHGVRSNVPQFDKDAAKRKVGISGPVYLAIGNIGPTKGFDIILKQARKIGKTILIVGNEPPRGSISRTYLDKLREFWKKNHLEKLVRFDISDIDSTKKLWWVYFAAADIVLLPYRAMATSGIFINAMEAKKPVVGSDTRYLCEISGKYGCVKIAKRGKDYPSVIKDAMKHLKEMESEAERFVQENSLEKIGEKYKCLYESILKE
jgi:glycosyltransferase involved in cell wall biosynthesis